MCRKDIPLDENAAIVRFSGRLRAAASVAAIALSLASTAARAGGGPENVFLLVNANSDSSKTIANHYIALRKISPGNVFYVDWKWSLEFARGSGLRDHFLMPALKAIAARGLGQQIDYLVYSSDFPWRIDLNNLFPPDMKFQKGFPPNSSLTGSTYLGAMLIGETADPDVFSPASNWYVPTRDGQNLFRCQRLGDVPSRGFHFRYFWNPIGERTKNSYEGRRYFLSTMLGVTSGRGNTVEEVISYLRRSASADGTRPKGTIYYMWNNDVRSTTRHACYEGAAAAIDRLGVKARVIQGTLPKNAPDIMGLMAGTSWFDFKATGSTIRPGAICEHLTSAGGRLGVKGKQTPLTEFLKYGAAGASGTIVEPLAIQAKFPLPSLHLHYARGCSLAESFYQSVASPYQLLVVGDPLCQPWAVIPRVTLPGVTAGQEVKGTLTLSPSATTGEGHRVGTLELYVDGRLVARGAPGKAFSLDTTKLPDGHHELRVVGIHQDPIDTQGRVVVPIIVNNDGNQVSLAVEPPERVAAGGKIRISVRAAGATTIIIRQNSRQVARVEGEAGDVVIDAAMLGKGPTTLQAIGEGGTAAVSRPVSLQVE